MTGMMNGRADAVAPLAAAPGRAAATALELSLLSFVVFLAPPGTAGSSVRHVGRQSMEGTDSIQTCVFHMEIFVSLSILFAELDAFPKQKKRAK